MQKRRKFRAAERYAIGIGVQIAVMAALLLAAAAILTATRDPAAGTGIGTLAAVTVSAAVSGRILPHIDGQDEKSRVIAGGAFALLMLLIGLLLGRGRIGGGGAMNVGCYLAIFLLLSLLPKRKRRKSHIH